MGMIDPPEYEEFSEHRIEFKPSNHVPILLLNEDKRILELASWGFVPLWSDGGKMARPINARSETVSTSPMFRDAFKSSRCLIPASGFFEPKGPKTGKKREQFYFHRPDREPIVMAGLRGGSNTCLILTTTASEVVAPIHDRMPVIVKPEDYEVWLNADTPAETLKSLMVPSSMALTVEQEQKPVEKKAEPGLFG